MDSHRRNVLLLSLELILDRLMRVLVLGGTTEASTLVRRLAADRRFALTLSLAGRTRAPLPQPVTRRVGGFGGAEGLIKWLDEAGIDAIVDATHPFAARISANAVEAARHSRLPLLTVIRPAWEQGDGDAWHRVNSSQAAVDAIGPSCKRVFLTIGRQETAAFRSAPHHTYVVRAIDRPEPCSLPPSAEIVLQRGPFDRAAELALMRNHRIDCLVAKNSGGGATYAKIEAARELRMPVVMIDRPRKPAMLTVETVEAAQSWLLEQAAGHPNALSDRGV